MLLLRLAHILAGTLWVGAVVFIAAFLFPAVRAIGPAGGPLMRHLTQVGRLPIYMMAAAILTIFSGIALYWRDSNGFQADWMHSRTGLTLGAGGLLGLIGAVYGMIVNSPAGKRLGALAASLQAAGRAPTPEETAEMARLQSRLSSGSRLVAALVIAATAAMAMARYVG